MSHANLFQQSFLLRRETEIDAIGVIIIVTEIDTVDRPMVVVVVVGHEEVVVVVITMKDTGLLPPASLVDHQAATVDPEEVASHPTVAEASQETFHHPTQVIEGEDVPPVVTMVHPESVF